MKKLQTLTAKTAVLTLVALAAPVVTASAAPVDITNPNFATNASSFSAYGGYADQGTSPASIPGWTAVGDSSTSSGGVGVDGTAAVYTPFRPFNYGSQTTDPATFAFIQVTSSSATPAAAGSNYLYQDITLASDTTYSLSFQAAERAIGLGDGGVTAAVNIVSTLDSITTPLLTFGLAPSNGDFLTYDATSNPTLTFTTGVLLPGTVVSIELQNTSNITDSGDHTIDFSNIAINSLATPEPSTWAFLGLGGLALVLVSLRRSAKI